MMTKTRKPPPFGGESRAETTVEQREKGPGMSCGVRVGNGEGGDDDGGEVGFLWSGDCQSWRLSPTAADKPLKNRGGGAAVERANGGGSERRENPYRQCAASGQQLQ